ncbi:MAG: glutaredoxin family protein [Opitutales bacterium]|nr:glutaredoxin family protein [Opitutales bacterium]
MKPKSIRIYIKPFCGWCHEAIDWLNAHGFKYTKLDVTSDRAAALEIKNLTGQTKAPSIDIDGHILPDFETRELERFLKKLGIEY